MARGRLLPAAIGLAAVAVLVAAVGVAVAQRLPATSALGQRTGFSPGAGIMHAPQDEVERELDLIVDSGARWIRLDFDWSWVERERGEPDWSALDRVVGAADSRGISVLALLTYTPKWDRPEGTSSHHPPDDPEDFARFAAAAVERFAPRGVDTYEIWNEPNLPQFWEPEPDVERYAALLEVAAEAVRDAAPGVTVLSGGLAPASDEGEDGEIDPRTFLEELYELDAGADFDAVAVHPYSYPATPTQPGTSDYNTFQKLPAMHETMADNGEGDELIWLTEVGAPTGSARGAVSEPRQAEIVLDAVRSAAELPWAGPLFVYATRDAGTDPDDREDNFGLLRRDFSPKNAWDELRKELRAR